MRHAIKRLADGRRRDTAGVIAAPPLLFGAALLLALVLHANYPMDIASRGHGAMRLAGVALIVVGLVLSGAVMREFGRACRLPAAPAASNTAPIEAHCPMQ